MKRETFMVGMLVTVTIAAVVASMFVSYYAGFANGIAAAALQGGISGNPAAQKLMIAWKWLAATFVLCLPLVWCSVKWWRELASYPMSLKG